MKRNYVLNAIEGFNPYDFLKDSFNMDGNPFMNPDGTQMQYLPATVKIFWFRVKYPNGRIVVEKMDSSNPNVVRYNAKVFADKSDEMPLSSWEYEAFLRSDDSPAIITAKLQGAETIALGKALSRAGFGCEIEMNLGIDSNESDAPAEDKKQIKAKTKRKRADNPPEKKEMDEKAAENDADGVDDLINMIDEINTTETDRKTEKEEESSDEMSLADALATVITVTDKATVKIGRQEGKVLGDVVNDIPGFAKTLLRPNIRKQVTDDVIKAAEVIAKNNK